MQRKVFSFKSISKLMIMSAFAMTLALGGAKVSSAETRQQSVDGVTDWLFGNLHPELNRRKLRTNEYEYIREWQAIRNVIDQGGLQYQKVDPKNNACDVPAWFYSNHDEALRERLADAVFYSRYPRRKGVPISPSDRALIQEWLKLKNSMFVAYC
jgi:hypothetical protein